MGIHVLGPVWVDGDGTLRPRDRRVLAALAVRHGQVLTAAAIADAVWTGDPPASWAKQVQICIARLRKAVGTAAIETVGGGYRLVTTGVELDVVTMEGLLSRGQALMGVGEADRAAATFDRAALLWRGAPFDDLDAWAPAQVERARLQELHRTLQEDLLEARLLSGEHRAAAAGAEALVADEPLRERRWALLARAQYRCGRQAEALRSLRLARRRLVEELGIDPGGELVALEAAILRQDEALLAVAERTISEECPYKGLAPFEPGDRLFGRDSEVAAILARTATSAFLVLSGPSGCGKSSLLRAGVMAALQRLGRPVVLVVPGADGRLSVPAHHAYADPARGPVLVVDQLEELFAVGHPDGTVRDGCARLVAHARETGPVIAAVRADHLVSLGADESLGRLIEQGLHLVHPLTGDQLREAIERPAAEAGLRIEQGLVDLLVRDTEGEPGAMPLLSHALAETWLRRDGTVLTVEGYRASGGIRGAVARSADRLYDSLLPNQRTVLRSLMLRLVAPSVHGDPIRSRVPFARLRGDLDRERVLALLIRDRLVTAEDEGAEISHEALARAWPRLQSWLDDDVAGQRVLRHLTSAADGWDSLGRPDSELYRGGRLGTAAEYRQSARPDLTVVEEAFLNASMAHADAERLALQAGARYDARRNRRLRVLLTTAVVLLLVAVSSGALAARSARHAGEQRDAAQAAVDSARRETLLNRSLALRSTNRDVAALLAVEAGRRWPEDPRSLSALLGTFTASRGFLGHQYVADAASLTGALVPGTSTAVVADAGRVELRDLATARVLRRLDESDAAGRFNRKVVVSADGLRAAVLRGVEDPACFDLDRLRTAVASACASVSVYLLATGERLLGPLTPSVGPGDVALSSDGALLAVAGGHDGALALYRTADGRALRGVPGLARPDSADQVLDTAGVAFAPDGTVYLGSLSGRIRLVDPVRGTVVRVVDAPAYSSNQHVSVGSDHLVVTGGQQWLFAGDARTGAAVWRQDLRGRHPDPCPYFAVSQAAAALYCGNHFGQIEQRHRDTGQRTGVVLDPQLGDVGQLGLSGAGDELVAFGARVPAISRWRLDGAGPVTRLVARGHVTADGYDFGGGSTLVVAERSPTTAAIGDYGDFALWDVAADRQVDPLDVGWGGLGWAGLDTLVGFDPVRGRLGFYDTGRHAATPGAEITADCDHVWASAGGRFAYCGFVDGRVWTIDARTRARVGPVIRVAGLPSSVSATRDGAVVVVTARRSAGNVTTVHDGVDGRTLAPPLTGPDITSVSLDGRLAGARGGAVTRYDLMSGRTLAELPGARGEVNTLQFSSDGRLLLATSNDQTASLYDVATGTRLGDPLPADAPLSYPAYLRPDGGQVAVTGGHGIAVWDLDPAHLGRAACLLAGRNLSGSEWETYLGDLGAYRRTCPGYVAAS